MLPSECDCVAPAQTGIDQHVEPHALFGSDRPASLILGNIILGPDRETLVFRTLRILDARRGIGLQVSGIDEPPKEAAHCIEGIAGLCRRVSAPLASGNDITPLDVTDVLVA
jgi:hypothetical protein